MRMVILMLSRWDNLKWDKINRFGKNRILRSSYIWLFVVPMASKALSSVSDPVVFTGLSEGLRIHFTLPFSWVLFYFSAVFVSIANVVYEFACPDFIKKFNTFSEFLAEGRNFENLLVEAELIQQQARTEEEGFNSVFIKHDIEKASHSAGQHNTDSTNSLGDNFWRLHSIRNSESPFWIKLCFVLYAIGLLLITCVLFQNFIFIVHANLFL